MERRVQSPIESHLVRVPNLKRREQTLSHSYSCPNLTTTAELLLLTIFESIHRSMSRDDIREAISSKDWYEETSDEKFCWFWRMDVPTTKGNLLFTNHLVQPVVVSYKLSQVILWEFLKIAPLHIWILNNTICRYIRFPWFSPQMKPFVSIQNVFVLNHLCWCSSRSNLLQITPCGAEILTASGDRVHLSMFKPYVGSWLEINYF